MTRALCLVFFASGAAALLFETLWFRQAGLALGNTVWATALVTASFMGGLAIGNALAARYGRRVQRPLAIFALMEVIVGASGVALVFGFPVIAATLAPLLGSLAAPATLNGVRIAVAFLLLVIPSSAMGATLPLLARTLSAWDENFGRVLGRLYGWNTLGAVAGAVAGELFLIGALGIRGTALAAASLDLLAAGVAFILSRSMAPIPSVVASGERAPLRAGARGRRIIVAAFLSGALLLALEVVWFRFSLLFFASTSLTFALLLAVVLLGISAGGFAGSVWLHRQPEGYRFAPIVALAGGSAVVVAYAGFPAALAPHGAHLVVLPIDVFWLSVKLIFPVCVFSGVLFTLFGKALHAQVEEEAWAAGTVTVANTMGAMLGALVGGFVLLPRLGMERSLFVLALGYLVVALVTPWSVRAGRERLAQIVAWGLCLVVIALFPFGLMNSRYMRLVVQRWSEDGSFVVAAKEGLTETVVIFRRDLLGHPVSYRLVTNGAGMSATGKIASRYMGLFVWWPVAVHPEPKTALLISHGMGTTARALTETQSLVSIDVVDISADVLQLSAVAFAPGSNPLEDPRVRTHVEDGRFFLATARQQYDIITAEPPPPRAAGIVNLYSQEYFQLIHDRLEDGGIATYWLPVYQMEADEIRAIIRGFCAVFEDCSLWTGQALEWMLVGGRGAGVPAMLEQFVQQWEDPVVLSRLRDAALESPAQLGALFLADAANLRELTANDLSLDDDHPHRLSPQRRGPPSLASMSFYLEMMDTAGARERFVNSEWIRRRWPESLREQSVAEFATQERLNRLLLGPSYYTREAAPVGSAASLAELDAFLTGTTLETPVLWAAGTSAEEQRIAQALKSGGGQMPILDEILGLGALSRRDYRGADEGLARAEPHADHANIIRQWRVLALGLDGDMEAAARLLAEARAVFSHQDPAPWNYLAERFQLSPETAR
jgi:predicted membrane-bound spermidine synthase